MANGEMMILNDKCEAKNDPDRKARKTLTKNLVIVCLNLLAYYFNGFGNRYYWKSVMRSFARED